MMYQTVQRNHDFAESILTNDLLDKAIEWIADHLMPSEVFDASELEDWALDNGFVKE